MYGACKQYTDTCHCKRRPPPDVNAVHYQVNQTSDCCRKGKYVQYEVEYLTAPIEIPYVSLL
jgi:hypothetical protein